MLPTDERFGKVHIFPFHVILVTVLKDRRNVSAWKMVPGQELNLHVVRETETFNNVIYNKQFSIDNELNGYSVSTADHLKST